jgi:hypothetical protein
MEQIIKMDYETLKTMGENGRKKIIAEFNEDIVLEFYKLLLKDTLNVKKDIPIKAVG